MATAEQIRAGVGSYIERHIMPRLDSKRQFLVGMAYGVASGRVDALVQAACGSAALRALGIAKENGEIDLDALYNAALNQMQAQKKLEIEVPLLGAFAFDEGDLRELYNAIEGRA